MTLSVRGSSISYVNNTNSTTFTLPSGSAAGDTCYIFAGHGGAVTVPTGWNTADNETGTNVNGAVFFKTLTSTDITAGSVSISFGAISYGIVSGITFIGATVMRSLGQYLRNSTGAGPRTLTEPNATNGDYAIYFGMIKLNSTITPSRGSSLQTSSNLNASGILYGELLSSTASISETYTFGATPTGDYESLLVVKVDDGTTTVDEFQLSRQALLTNQSIQFNQISRQSLQVLTPISINQTSRLTLRNSTTSPVSISVNGLARLTLKSGHRRRQIFQS
jgi:hypothetical protein